MIVVSDVSGIGGKQQTCAEVSAGTTKGRAGPFCCTVSLNAFNLFSLSPRSDCTAEPVHEVRSACCYGQKDNSPELHDNDVTSLCALVTLIHGYDYFNCSAWTKLPTVWF